MENPTFRQYQVFTDREEAHYIMTLLSENEIPVHLTDSTKNFDVSFSFSTHDIHYVLSIPKEDFSKADQIQMDIWEKQLDDVEDDYYLLSYSQEELMNSVISRRDEWSLFDYLLALRILKNQGVIIDDDTLNTIQQQRLNELSKPEKRQITLVILGYLSALTFPLAGIYLGYFLKSHSKTLPDGHIVRVSHPQDIFHGKIIFVVSVATLSIFIISFIVTTIPL